MSYDIDYTPDQRINRLAERINDLDNRVNDLEDELLDDDELEADDDFEVMRVVSYTEVETIVNRHCGMFSGSLMALSELRRLFGVE